MHHRLSSAAFGAVCLPQLELIIQPFKSLLRTISMTVGEKYFRP